MEAEKQQAPWPHSGNKGKVPFSPALNLIPLLRVDDLQKQTELALPVNTHPSEIKVTSPKFVCLKQIKRSAAQYPYKMLARKTAIVDEPLNFRWL